MANNDWLVGSHSARYMGLVHSLPVLLLLLLLLLDFDPVVLVFESDIESVRS